MPRSQSCPFKASRGVVGDWKEERLTFPPQHMPTAPHFSIPVACFSISFSNPGTFFAVSGGLAGPAKNSPSFFFFSSVSGGYSLWVRGLPRKKSGMKTWY